MGRSSSCVLRTELNTAVLCYRRPPAIVHFIRCTTVLLHPHPHDSAARRLQVFDAFLHSFTTYRSLLMRIKSEYDVALDDALASLYDNVSGAPSMMHRLAALLACVCRSRLGAMMP